MGLPTWSKSNRDWRLWGEYCVINRVNVPDRHVLPQPHESFNGLWAKGFSRSLVWNWCIVESLSLLRFQKLSSQHYLVFENAFVEVHGPRTSCALISSSFPVQANTNNAGNSVSFFSTSLSMTLPSSSVYSGCSVHQNHQNDFHLQSSGCASFYMSTLKWASQRTARLRLRRLRACSYR